MGKTDRTTYAWVRKAYDHTATLAGKIYRNPRAIPRHLCRYGLRVLRVCLPHLSSYTSAWWRLRSGRYGVEMRAQLEKHLWRLSRPLQTDARRIFHGLYHAPQPVFLNRAFQEKGCISSYETFDLNPGFPAVDTYHHMRHPDMYREHTVIAQDVLIHNRPVVVNHTHLAQLEQFFLEKWSQYDVFHFNWFLSFLPDNLDVEFLRRSGRPVYFHFRGCFILTQIIHEFTERGETVADACQHCKRMGWREAYFARFYRGIQHASRVFTSTPNLCHCAPEFEHVPNSLEPAMACIPPPLPKTARPDAPVVIMHAAFHASVQRYKGTPHIVRAVATLQREGYNVELKIIEHMSRAAAVQHYGQCDIFVEQLHLGCYSNVAIEAMAYGVPVVSSLPPAHAHLTPHCPIIHADPLTITDRLRELVIDPTRRAEIGQRSYKWVREFHANEKIAAHLLRIYHRSGVPGAWSQKYPTESDPNV